MIRTAKSKSLSVTARPRAQEFTTKSVSTCACAEKKSPANSATSRWSSVGNLGGEIINCVVRPQRSGSTARGAFSRPNYDSTKPRFACFGCSSGETLDKTKISIRFCGHRSWLPANSFYVNCNGYRGRSHRVGVMWDPAGLLEGNTTRQGLFGLVRVVAAT